MLTHTYIRHVQTSARDISRLWSLEGMYRAESDDHDSQCSRLSTLSSPHLALQCVTLSGF